MAMFRGQVAGRGHKARCENLGQENEFSMRALAWMMGDSSWKRTSERARKQGLKHPEWSGLSWPRSASTR